MTSAHSHYIIIFRTDNMKTTLFSAFFSLVDTFKNHIGFFRFVDGNHFHLKVTSGHKPRERFLAYFALEFCEVVGDHHASDFLFDFAINPHLETLDVDALARSFAFAWRDEEVVRAVIITEAEFAGSFLLFHSIMNSVKFPQEKLFLLIICFFSAPDLNNSVLDSS